MNRIFAPLLFLTVMAFSLFGQIPHWPAITHETKPWTRWWWHGSAVTKEGITAELESFRDAGLGGVEITPIYGVYGYENKFVPFLSSEWMDLLTHTLREAERLGLGVDMATGTGWPFGGPWVTEDDACKNFQYKLYRVKGGTSLDEKIKFIQPPYLRAIGSFIYETNEPEQVQLKEGATGFSTRNISIHNLKSPIASNPNLQALAIDQVQFEKPLRLITVMAYGPSGDIVDLTNLVDTNGTLNWIAPEGGEWILYALFEGWHGKMVERAAPGGEGNVIDHFSPDALRHYLDRFDKAIQGNDIQSLRAFFNDSYEVDDAKGAADWTPNLFDEFQKRRGYDLRLHLPALLGQDTEDKNQRVLSDYRETLGDMLRDHFTQQWKTWAAGHNAIVRNQAHGSPANILDLYGIVDIPEIEGVEPLRIKMASSAGNVMGKRLISAEAVTWLDEHFESNLADIKTALDRFMLNGVNHLFYHGTAYSPQGEPWPGWLFYAAVHLNNRNPLWKDVYVLNKYVERCQSFLQNTLPDNDILLYFPIYDAFATRGPKNLTHFDGIGRQFAGSNFEQTADALHREGYGFDYISDAQIINLSAVKGQIITEGGSSYKVIVIPACRFMPVSTLEKIEALMREGINIAFIHDLPASFAGFSDFENARKKFANLKRQIQSAAEKKKNVRILKEVSGQGWLSQIASKETITTHGLFFIRKKQSDGTRLYFINNPASKSFSGWVSLAFDDKPFVLFDPMTGEIGKARTRNTVNKKEVYLQLSPGQSILVQSYKKEPIIAEYFYFEEGQPIPIEGEWHLEFLTGGPHLPPPVKTRTLSSWTTLGDSTYRNFSGTCSYKIQFQKPNVPAQDYWIDLGTVKESASVILNGEYIGTAIGPDYRLKISSTLLKDINMLEVQVTNLMANRISWMDRNKIFWKKFYNANIAARKPENRRNGIFHASHWNPKDSGLLGPVRLISMRQLTINN